MQDDDGTRAWEPSPKLQREAPGGTHGGSAGAQRDDRSEQEEVQHQHVPFAPRIPNSSTAEARRFSPAGQGEAGGMLTLVRV